jgi:hypothetical protein
MKTLKQVTIDIHGFCRTIVFVDMENKHATAQDENSSFGGSGCIGHDGKLVAITNDITTNYLEVAMAMAMRKVGLKVKAERPTPRNLTSGKTRRFTIISVEDKVVHDVIHNGD